MSNTLVEKDPNFITKYYLSLDESYSDKHYMNLCMRTSIFERLLAIFLFEGASKNYSLLQFISDLKKDPTKMNKVLERINIIQELFKDEGPLSFYVEYSKEIQRLLKEDINSLKIDKFILKTEFLLACHFQNNFFEKLIDAPMNQNSYENLFLAKDKTNFNFSIGCLKTIFDFLKVFEIQNLSTRIGNDFLQVKDLISSEKIYYFKCDYLNKEKPNVGNLAEYLLMHLMKKIEQMKTTKMHNPQTESYTLITLYLINLIIQNYSFYFYKTPEFSNIFNTIAKLKIFPIPIGNFCKDALETIINEGTFQGISVLNKLREKYLIDFLNINASNLETKFYGSTLFMTSQLWDVRHAKSINTDKPSGFNLTKFIKRLIERPRSIRKQNFNLRELIVRIFISFLLNSKEEISNDLIEKIYLNFFPDYKEFYSEANKGNLNKYDNASTKNNLDMLLKIIDVGFDKPIEEFNKDINMIVKKLMKLENKGQSSSNVFNNSFYLPLTYLRSYLKPYYSDHKVMSAEIKEDFALQLFNFYADRFKYVIRNYYPHLLCESSDNIVEENLKNLRQKIYINYKVNIVLIEDTNTIRDFINTITKEIVHRIPDEDFNSFWKYFVKSKGELKMNYLLHVLPHYEHSREIPFKLIRTTDNLPQEEKLENSISYLSEFMALKDSIYKNFVYIPWSSKCDEEFYSYVPTLKLKSDKILEAPTLDSVYSFLKKPLDYYITESKGIFNLNIYNLLFNDQSKKNFWKNFDLTAMKSTNCKLTLLGVDYLGVEDKEEKKLELTLNAPFKIKMFNLFFKKDVPFNCNVTSNNGWLEIYLCEKYEKEDREEIEKVCKFSEFIKNSNETKYLEEFNVQQMDLQSFFKNYKAKSVVIEADTFEGMTICDDDQGLKATNEKGRFKLEVRPLTRNGENVTLPIATFISI
ncbi:MAG: hypothetical protein MJ252_03940 [archaeon]|nr:hypothetical protein [archaeon]